MLSRRNAYTWSKRPRWERGVIVNSCFKHGHRFLTIPEWGKGGWPDVQNLVNRKSGRLILTSQGSLNFSVFFTFPKLVTSFESCLYKEDIWRRMCLGGYNLRTPRKHLARSADDQFWRSSQSVSRNNFCTNLCLCKSESLWWRSSVRVWRCVM